MKTLAADYESLHIDVGIMGADCDGLVKIAGSTAMKVHPYLFACLLSVLSVFLYCLSICLTFFLSVRLHVGLFVYKNRNGKIEPALSRNIDWT